MAIYGIGAYYEEDVSAQFMARNLVGVGHKYADAPELHEFIRALKVGDIVYIKSYPPRAETITVKGIGLIIDSQFVDYSDSNDLVQAGRNIRWITSEQFEINPPSEKNNVRFNALYEEWHPEVQRTILERLLARLNS